MSIANIMSWHTLHQSHVRRQRDEAHKKQRARRKEYDVMLRTDPIEDNAHEYIPDELCTEAIKAMRGDVK